MYLKASSRIPIHLPTGIATRIDGGFSSRNLSMALTILILVTLAALANLADFLLGARGQRNLKDRMVRYYIVAAESDWTTMIRVPAYLYERYLTFVLEQKY
jgi:hypothetical protein